MNRKHLRWLVASSMLAFVAAPVSADRGDVIAVFNLEGPLLEAPPEFEMGALFGGKPPLTMLNLLERLRKARTDNAVQGVVLDIEESALGLAQIQELRRQIEAIRAAEKDVWVYCETLQPGTILLGSSASQLIMMPRGLVDFSGFYGEALYFKNMLDNIGVEADILHCGDYKSAGEPFYRTGPSEEAKAQQNRLLDSIFSQWMEQIAKSRKLTPERVRELVDVAIFSPEEAHEAQLIDGVAYRQDFIESLRRRYGTGTKLDGNYGDGSSGLDIDFNDPFAFFKIFGEIMKGPKKSTAEAVAVVYVDGMIQSGESEPGIFGSSGAYSETIRKAIAEAAEDKSVKGLVMRVDSPGGSAIASEVICEAAKRFRDTGRPFVVSMGNVAGSGGYYVSTLADTIYAEPGTITGSIGVVGGKMVTKGLWDWVGVTGHEYKRGKFADAMNSNRRWSDAERELIWKYMTRTYKEFKGRVMEGRSDRIKGDLEPLAGGRVYTGAEALEIGLVDRLGGLSEAVKHAAREAELGTKYEIRVFPRPKTLIDMFAEAFGGGEKDEHLLSAPNRRFAGLLAMPSNLQMLQAVRAVDPAKAKQIENFLKQVELLSKEGVLLIGPPEVHFRP